MPLPLHAVLDPAVRAGLIDPETAVRVRRDVQQGHADPVRSISLHGRIPSSSIFRAVAADRGIDYVERAQLGLRPDLLRKMPKALVRRKLVLPVQEKDDWVLLATSDLEAIGDGRLEETLRQAFGKQVRLALADPNELKPLIEKALEEPLPVLASPSAEDAVGFVAEIIREAFIHRASDIHIEPDARAFRVRFRVDGDLRTFREGLPGALALAALSRIKVLARMDIAESREPQDGSFTWAVEGSGGRRFDIRVATAPTQQGERATLRLLGAEVKDLTLGDLGFSPGMYGRFSELIRRPSGLILLTGPTGSGKTTTLYAALREINHPSLNILTVEDPVEYFVPGVSQLEVDGAGKVTFASALRSLLRHDPDVLMIGEIRDMDTADMALRAAVTGHLVFSTLHTSTAVGAVTRLVDMGCEPYMIASTLTTVVSQRLVRRLCPACKSPRAQNDDDRSFLKTGTGEEQVSEPRGCLRCQMAGFMGRIGVFEMFEADDAVREKIAGGAGEKAIAQAAGSLTTLQEDAVAKVLAGLTTAGEARRAVVLEG